MNCIKIITKLWVVFEGRTLEIDIQKELSINENLLNSQLNDSPSSYYILASLRDKYIKQRDALAREKEEAYSAAWVFIKFDISQKKQRKALIEIFVNKAKNKKFLLLYICILAVLAIATIGVCIAMI